MLSGQFLTMTLEDGEKVVRLGGGRGQARKSDRPHAGQWGKETSYVLLPCRSARQVTIRSQACMASVPGLTDRSGEDSVLMLGSHADIERLLTTGPRWCRALRSRKGLPRTEAQQAASARLKGAKP